MSGEARIAVTVRITGRVQGVAYRYWTQTQAKRLNISGWVRNMADGSVEALFAGSPGAIDAMINTCRDGPRMARVTDIATSPVAPVPPEGAGSAGFQIAR